MDRSGFARARSCVVVGPSEGECVVYTCVVSPKWNLSAQWLLGSRSLNSIQVLFLPPLAYDLWSVIFPPPDLYLASERIVTE